MTHVAQSGLIFAFVYGIGLAVANDPAGRWILRADEFGERALLHMAVDPTDRQVVHVVAETGAILTSLDGGGTWRSYVGHRRETLALITSAGKLYGQLCESCHGAKGVGERPDDKHGTDEYGYVAPPLDDSSHGWHHSDQNLTQTILEGSSRNPRMIPFGALITEPEARDLVAYIRSLWSFSSLACQGARHMRCRH